MDTPNRDLDVYMAQKVLGHTTYYEQSGAVRERLPNGTTRPLSPYSTEIASSWEIVEKLGVTMIPVDGGWFSLIGPTPRWGAPADFLRFVQNTDFTKAGAALADLASHSICLAALRATETRLAAEAGELMDEASTDFPN